jgi:hypothetical protein
VHRQIDVFVQGRHAMRFLHHDFAFEISDEWWVEAGMLGFVHGSQSYRVDSQAFPDRRVYEVRIDEVAPVPRQLSHGVFHNDAMTGLGAKNCVINILRGFLIGAAIPPVEILRLPSDALYTYRLKRGAHRFYLSIGAGFSHVPAVDRVE